MASVMGGGVPERTEWETEPTLPVPRKPDRERLREHTASRAC